MSMPTGPSVPTISPDPQPPSTPSLPPSPTISPSPTTVTSPPTANEPTIAPSSSKNIPPSMPFRTLSPTVESSEEIPGGAVGTTMSFQGFYNGSLSVSLVTLLVGLTTTLLLFAI